MPLLVFRGPYIMDIRVFLRSPGSIGTAKNLKSYSTINEVRIRAQDKLLEGF